MPTVAFSLVPPETINHHLANYSPTKQVHQFSKTPRFLTSNPEYFITDSDAPMLSTPTIVSFLKGRPASATAVNMTSQGLT